MQRLSVTFSLFSVALALAGCASEVPTGGITGSALADANAAHQCSRRDGSLGGVAGFAARPNEAYVQGLRNADAPGKNGVVALTFTAENPAALEHAARVAQILAGRGAVGNFFLGAGIAKEIITPEQLANTFATAAPLRDGRNLVAPYVHHGFRAQRFGGEEYQPFPFVVPETEGNPGYPETDLAALRADYESVLSQLADLGLLTYNAREFGRISYVEKTGSAVNVPVTCEMFEDAHAGLGINLVGWHVDDRAGTFACASASDTSCETAYVNHLLYGDAAGYDPGILDFHADNDGAGAIVQIDLESSLFDDAARTKRIFDALLASITYEGMTTVRLDQGFGYDDIGTERAYSADAVPFLDYYSTSYRIGDGALTRMPSTTTLPQIACISDEAYRHPCGFYSVPVDEAIIQANGTAEELSGVYMLARYSAPRGARIVVEMVQDAGTSEFEAWQGDTDLPRGAGSSLERVVSYVRPLADGTDEITFIGYLGLTTGSHDWAITAFQAIVEGAVVPETTMTAWNLILVPVPANG